MLTWGFLAGLAGSMTFLVGRGAYRRSHQHAAAKASGLTPVADLSHLPAALQRTALWALGDGGFERRVVHGTLPRTPVEPGAPYRSSNHAATSFDVTAFDLETLRERRGEWAWLPVEPPFRIGGVLSVVVCELDRSFPHTLFKCMGVGDEMRDDAWVDRQLNIAKRARASFGLRRSYASELPPGLDRKPLAIELPDEWRVYGRDPDPVRALLQDGFVDTLVAARSRDLVIEMLDGLVVVYPAASDVSDTEAFAHLSRTAVVIVDGLLAATPRRAKGR